MLMEMFPWSMITQFFLTLSQIFSVFLSFFSVAIMLKDDYFVRGAGLPGRFKAEKVEFHWGPSNGSEGSEHSINGRRYPVEVGTICEATKFFYGDVGVERGASSAYLAVSLENGHILMGWLIKCFLSS